MKKGVILITVILLTVVISVYLASYAIWTIYDQRSLLVQQQAENALRLARAGLERARMDLYADSDWDDGTINKTNVTSSDPDDPDPDPLPVLYSNVHLGEGNYTVEIDYLQNPGDCAAGCDFHKQKIFVRSTGTIDYTASGGRNTTKTLEEYVWKNIVKNNITEEFYNELQPAVNAANSGNYIHITDCRLEEDVIINKDLIIEGCYDSGFKERDCANYRTIISGTVTVLPGFNVTMGGIIIE